MRVMAHNALCFILFFYFPENIWGLLPQKKIKLSFIKLFKDKILSVSVNSLPTIIYAKLQLFFFFHLPFYTYQHGSQSAILPPSPCEHLLHLFVITLAFIILSKLANCVTSLLILFFRSLMNTSPWDSMVIFFQ